MPILRATVSIAAYKDDSFRTSIGLPLSKTVVINTEEQNAYSILETLGNSLISKTQREINTECLLKRGEDEKIS